MLVLLSLSACQNWDRKYEEGPLVSPFPASHRAANTWKWAYFDDNGQNRSGEYADSTLVLGADNVAKICGPQDVCREGTWRLISKREQLQLIFGNDAVAYDIQMLRRKEMWLSFSSADSTYELNWQLVAVGEE